MIVLDFFLPPDEDAAVAIEPRGDSLDHPAASALAPRSLLRPLLPARLDVRLIAAASETLANRPRVVPQIAAQMLPAMSGTGPTDRDAVERIEQKFLVVSIGAADRQSDRHPATVGENRPLNAQLAAIGGVFAGFFSPPSGDLVIDPSTLCQFQPIPSRRS